MNNEAIVYIARKLHWSREEIGELTLTQFNEILEELQFQEAQEQYRQDFSIASILAAVYNTIPSKSRKTFKPRDFLGGAEPKRMDSNLAKAAEAEGIEIPKEE
ncbi:hypothetical protein ES703_09100 [subsurface metagenome]